MEDVNWDVVSAVSNIILSFLTFVGLMITLYFSVKNSFYKLKLEYRINQNWTMKVVNKRNVPVSLMAYGFMFRSDDGRELLIEGHVQKGKDARLNWNEVVRYTMTEEDIRHRLFELKESEDRLIMVYIYAKTEDGKTYKKRTKKVSPKKKENLKLKLNT